MLEYSNDFFDSLFKVPGVRDYSFGDNILVAFPFTDQAAKRSTSLIVPEDGATMRELTPSALKCQDSNRTDLGDATDAPPPAERDSNGEKPRAARAIIGQTSEVGCVFAGTNPKIREMPPEAYAEFLEEL